LSTSPIIAEIMQKQRECHEKGFELETVFLNPVDLVNLLMNERFIDVSHYSQTTDIRPSGEIGKFQGISVVVSTHVPIHQLLYTVKMGNYRSVQGWTGDPVDSTLNPSRRDNRNGSELDNNYS